MTSTRLEPMTLYTLKTDDRCGVLTFSKEAADLWCQEMGPHMVEIHGEMVEQFEREVLEADKTIADWMSRFLAKRDADRRLRGV